MIYITGDTHIPIDISKLSTKNFLEQKNLTKNDYVIICGDFGGVWNGSNEDKYWCDWLNNKNFTTLFIDGNHENFNLLNSYKVDNWNNGKVHFIRDSVIHLMRGQVFVINGLKFFTMGGAKSTDKQFRKENKSWWKEEMPSIHEINEGIKNLNECSWIVDYIITHTTCSEIKKEIGFNDEDESNLQLFLDSLKNNCKYKQWYFGHFHKDMKLGKHTLLYRDIVKIC